jgi:hypothetical protein
MRNLHDVNEALMTLLPKSPDTAEIKDYRPISLIHCIWKLISKVLANRLAPKLSEVVNQAKVRSLMAVTFKTTSNLFKPQQSFFPSEKN